MKDKKQPSVLIMMATYNGDKYIEEQIKSIINQTYKNWELLIRDDGSSDKTISLIREFMKNDDRISLLENHSQNHGWKQNFQQLLLSVTEDAEYYLFCDQDDVWKENKLDIFVQEMCKIERTSPNTAVIVYGDVELIDDKGRLTYSSFNSIYNMRVKHATDAFFSQRIYGCNMMFNKGLLDAVVKTLDGQVYPSLCHDALTASVAAGVGGIIHYLEVPCMQYRRHGTNQTAHQDYAITWKRILSRMKKFEKLAKDQSSTYLQSSQVINLMLENLQLDKRLRMNLLEIKNAIECGGHALIRVWLKYHVDCGNLQRTVSHFLVLLTGKWKDKAKIG